MGFVKNDLVSGLTSEGVKVKGFIVCISNCVVVEDVNGKKIMVEKESLKRETIFIKLHAISEYGTLLIKEIGVQSKQEFEEVMKFYNNYKLKLEIK